MQVHVVTEQDRVGQRRALSSRSLPRRSCAASACSASKARARRRTNAELSMRVVAPTAALAFAQWPSTGRLRRNAHVHARLQGQPSPLTASRNGVRLLCDRRAPSKQTLGTSRSLGDPCDALARSRRARYPTAGQQVVELPGEPKKTRATRNSCKVDPKTGAWKQSCGSSCGWRRSRTPLA